MLALQGGKSFEVFLDAYNNQVCKSSTTAFQFPIPPQFVESSQRYAGSEFYVVMCL